MSGDEDEQLPEEELPVTDLAEPLVDTYFSSSRKFCGEPQRRPTFFKSLNPTDAQ